MNYSFPQLIETLARGGEGGRRLALATVVWTDGSTPQVIGASAVFSGEGLVAGTVGGGPLEARVEAAAGEALADGKARLVSIRLEADPSDMEGAVCGGAVRVLVDPGVGAERRAFEDAVAALKKRRGGTLVGRIEGGEGEAVEVRRGFLAAGAPARADDPVFGDIAPATLERTLAGGRPRLIGRGSGGLVFVEPVLPLPRLVIAGAGHVGRAVARLGQLLDFVVTVIDDRPEFANAANVPEADEIVVREFGPALAGVEDAPDNYFVIVTRGHAKDAEALRAVIGREAAYIGMIGSKIKVGLMKRRFLESGWATEAQWARIHSPIGLEIGSKTVEEIAVSIAAELVQVRSALKEAGAGEDGENAGAEAP